MTNFRVIGSMDEGNWASAPMAGFSIDNISPSVPLNVVWMMGGGLAWDHISDPDFAYYQVYGAASSIFDDAVPVGATVEPSYAVPVNEFDWFFITAVDNFGNHSEPTSPALVSGAPDALTSVRLFAAVPNPFNPSTKIEFALPHTAHVKIAIYDISGHLVEILVNESMQNGVHSIAWKGLDKIGRNVSAGTYFYRLETGDVVITKSMMLLK